MNGKWSEKTAVQAVSYFGYPDQLFLQNFRKKEEGAAPNFHKITQNTLLGIKQHKKGILQQLTKMTLAAKIFLQNKSDRQKYLFI